MLKTIVCTSSFIGEQHGVRHPIVCDQKRVIRVLNSTCLITPTGTVYNELVTQNEHARTAQRASGENLSLWEMVNEKLRQVS